jgi:hypothetical protein
MAAAGKMGRAPMLTGGPAKQANASAVKGPAMPKRSPGKPGKSILAQPSSVSANKKTKQPKGKGKQMRVAKGNVKNAPGKGGRLPMSDMGIAGA